jgi:hypothetical protein
MKWDATIIEKLKELINLGKRPIEIANELNVSKKSLSLKMHKLGLKIKYKDKIICLNCGIEFDSYVNIKSKFCGHPCSATYGNKNRKLTNDTKEKIKQSLLKTNSKKEKKEKKEKICKVCRKIINENFIRICETCKNEYYTHYRFACNFDFNVYYFPNKFDLELIKQYGWYSASNRGNNLNGISKDHMLSVKDGFINKISPEIIKHPANCKLMLHKENNIKKASSSISIDELLDRISKW